MFAFKKTFPHFMYTFHVQKSDSSEHSNPKEDAGKVECNGATQETQEEKPQNLKRGGHDH
jgi:hypothetical protein